MHGSTLYDTVGIITDGHSPVGRSTLIEAARQGVRAIYVGAHPAPLQVPSMTSVALPLAASFKRFKSTLTMSVRWRESLQRPYRLSESSIGS